VVKGVKRLTGAFVEATDLRAGAALVLAGMAAEGITVVENIGYIDRGYYELEQKYTMLGAKILRERILGVGEEINDSPSITGKNWFHKK
jgi:UDP-N-acetylglucosamine 1-carboxyvinyltransferase